MNGLIHIDRPVVTEGRYDKIKLESVIDALIITTDGFGIFRDAELKKYLRFISEKNGLIVLTDSDRAGFRIRAYIRSVVGADKVTDLYIPDVYGKERRKEAPSAEGKLGVEGIDADILRELFTAYARPAADAENDSQKLTVFDLYEAGLSGKKDSAKLRREVLRALGLPERLSSGSLLGVINRYAGRERFNAVMKELLS